MAREHRTIQSKSAPVVPNLLGTRTIMFASAKSTRVLIVGHPCVRGFDGFGAGEESRGFSIQYPFHAVDAFSSRSPRLHWSLEGRSVPRESHLPVLTADDLRTFFCEGFPSSAAGRQPRSVDRPPLSSSRLATHFCTRFHCCGRVFCSLQKSLG